MSEDGKTVGTLYAEENLTKFIIESYGFPEPVLCLCTVKDADRLNGQPIPLNEYQLFTAEEVSSLLIIETKAIPHTTGEWLWKRVLLCTKKNKNYIGWLSINR